MTPERLSVYEELFESHKKYHPETEVIFEGQASLLRERLWLWVVTSELLGNCLKKEGVTTVKITIENERLVVEDNVIHDDAEEIVLKLNSKKVETTKEGHFGMGIWGARINLSDHDGKLVYHAEGGKIIAVATWIE